jgi:hypothetical protein
MDALLGRIGDERSGCIREGMVDPEATDYHTNLKLDSVAGGC